MERGLWSLLGEAALCVAACVVIGFGYHRIAPEMSVLQGATLAMAAMALIKSIR